MAGQPRSVRRWVGRFMVGQYPRAFRERWGSDLADEAERAGWRGWWRLLGGMIGMWLHPAIWPSDSAVERRRRVAVLAVVVSAGGWLTAHAVLELTDAVPRALAHSLLLTSFDLTTFLGFALAVPLPRLRRVPMTQVVRSFAQRLALPFVVGAVVVLIVNQGMLSGPAVRYIVVPAWWLALLIGALQAVRSVAEVELSNVVVPGARRLRVGLWLAATGLTATGLAILFPAVAGSDDRIAGLTGGLMLLVLAAAVNGTIRDLAEVQTA